jgi:arabinose-5-phosphate isomerase
MKTLVIPEIPETSQTEQFCRLGTTVLNIEGNAVLALTSRIDEKFADACRYLLQCPGRVVVIGMGKSGHIANKIAATLASTGTPAFFVHPGEASHGDLGMITGQDVVLALSNSGETTEILTILPLIKRLSVPCISLTGNPRSTLAKTATVNIDVSVSEEACPLGLAPTSSTTAALAMGDALAIALLQARGFTRDDFALAHPGGSLGQRLLLRINDIMHINERVPRVSVLTRVSDALLEMTQKGLGMTAVLDEDGKITGIFTDGDLRRTLHRKLDIHNTQISHVMTTDCKTIKSDLLVAEALNIMEAFKITALLVTDDDNRPIGVVHMHDILKTGIV